MNIHHMIIPCLIGYVSAFISPSKTANSILSNQHCNNGNTFVKYQGSAYITRQIIASNIQQRRKSVASVQTMGLFGLGGAELVIILIAAVFVLGPENIGKIGREAGKMSSEFKDIPTEFQKGLEEGEIEARSKKAKQMEEPDD